MELKTFLDQSQNCEWWMGQAVIYFVVDTDYPILFFTQLFHALQPIIGVVRPVDLHDADNAHAARAAFESSFLGSKSYYWCKHFGSLDAKRRTLWLDYVKKYQGPNCLLVCVNQPPTGVEKHVVQVNISELAGTGEIQQLLAWAGVHEVKLRTFIAAELCKRAKSLPLDTVCLASRYGVLAGAECAAVLPKILDTMLLPEKSLFTLSGFLLARNAQQFFRAWAAVAYDFPEIFWISYWSDVCWRAYFFAQFMKAGKIAEAKQLGNRLPFSYLQRDWKSINALHLKEAVVALYGLDCDLKNGATNGYAALELVFMRLLETKPAAKAPAKSTRTLRPGRSY